MPIPQFCPNPECDFHNLDSLTSGERWYRKNGFYPTDTFGVVQRYKCLHCDKGFSDQTFSIDYYAKRKIPYKRILNQIISTGSIRDMSRELHATTETIQNRIDRLARQCIASHGRLIDKVKLWEDLAADGFESFTVSQFFPCTIHLLAGCDSQYIYFTNYVTMRRKGRMTEEQKEQRKNLEKRYRADKKGVQKGFRELVDAAVALWKRGLLDYLVLHTDEKPDYFRAIHRGSDAEELIREGRWFHTWTNSKEKRTGGNPLFAVNYLDRQIRKDLCEHVRETVCFGRNVSECMSRTAVYLWYHNYRKPFRVNGYGKYFRHAERAGLTRRDIHGAVKGVMSVRRFLSLEPVEPALKRVWLKELETPLWGKGSARYVPKYIAA